LRITAKKALSLSLLHRFLRHDLMHLNHSVLLSILYEVSVGLLKFDNLGLFLEFLLPVLFLHLLALLLDPLLLAGLFFLEPARFFLFPPLLLLHLLLELAL
jgi:hypothetical protein